MVEPTFLNRPPFSEFITFMTSLAGDSGGARYSEFELMDIYKLAPMLVLVDIERSPDRFKIRFVGTKVVGMYGRDNTGRYMDELDLGPSSAEILKIYDELIKTRQAHWTRDVVNKQSLPIDGREHFAYKRLSYPLLGKAGEVDHILALLVERLTTEAEKTLSWGPFIKSDTPETKPFPQDFL